jgi:hypothetical protein
LLGIILSFLVATSIAADNSDRDGPQPGNDGPVVHGDVVILKEAMTKSVSINVGGLLVVQIPDSQSHPPQGITVKSSSGNAQSLGHVRGVRSTDSGQTLFGGGYTWYLFRAVRPTEHLQINVSYVPNGTPKAIRLDCTHRVEIEAD